MRVSESLRAAIRESGRTQADIARATGINQSVISRFMAGDGLRSENLDVLAEHFRLVLVEKGSQKKGR